MRQTFVRYTAAVIRLWGFAALAVLVVGAGACKFDVAGAGATGGSPDGAISIVADAHRAIDAPPGAPDATPADPPGVFRSHRLPPGTTITLDGDLKDWTAAVFYGFDGPLSTVDVFSNQYIPSGTNAAVRFASFYDDQNIYFGFSVRDDIVNPPDSTVIYEDDSIEIYLDTGNDHAGPYGTDDHWLTFPASGTNNGDQFAGGVKPDMSSTSVTRTSAYVVEVRIGLASAPNPGDTWGFGAGMNDDDGLPNPGSEPNDSIDAYIPWFLSSRPSCATCCPATDPHPEPWCDDSRLGTLIFSP